jgi:protein disulfide-isomerase A6
MAKMCTLYVVVALCVLSSAYAKTLPSDAPHLTVADFDARVFGEGKGAFVKFYASWCAHCKKLAPVWNELAEEFANDASSVLVAKVDCIAEKPLCERFNVQGFPTLRAFTPLNGGEGEMYEGDRSIHALRAHIKKTFGPTCDPAARAETCTAEENEALDDLLTKDAETLRAAVATHEKDLKTSEDMFASLLQSLQTQYETATENKKTVETTVIPKLNIVRIALKYVLATTKDEL